MTREEVIDGELWRPLDDLDKHVISFYPRDMSYVFLATIESGAVQLFVVCPLRKTHLGEQKFNKIIKIAANKGCTHWRCGKFDIR